MIPLIVSLTCVLFYFLAGWLAAVRNLPRAWAGARDMWPETMARDSVKIRTACMFLFWLFYLPGRAIGVFLGHVIDAGDPKVTEKKVREQQERIRDLERELGIR